MIHVLRSKKAHSLHKGDVIVQKTIREAGEVLADADLEVLKTRKLGEVKVGRTKVTGWDTDGKECLYVGLNDDVLILAEEYTEEEQAAAQRERANARIVKMVEEGIESYNPVNVFTRLQTDRRGNDRNERTGMVYEIMDDLLIAQAHFDLLRAVQVLYTEEGRPSYGDAVDAMARVLATELEPSRSSFRALSRSTSVTGNLAADVRRQVAGEYMDDWSISPVKKLVFQLWAR